MAVRFKGYDPGSFYDELFGASSALAIRRHGFVPTFDLYAQARHEMIAVGVDEPLALELAQLAERAPGVADLVE